MPNIKQYEAGNVGLNPSETGVEAAAATARRLGMFFNQRASAEDMLAKSTEDLGRATGRLGGDTGRLSSETARLGQETARLGQETESLGAFEGGLLKDVGARAGSAVASAGDVAVQYMDHQEVSRGSAAFTGLTARATQQWNDTVKNADPNDTTVGPAFMQGIEPELEKFKQGFLTENSQKWAEGRVDALRQHLSDKTTADMGVLAGQAAKVNQDKIANDLANTVRSDPTSLDFALATAKSSVEDAISTSPTLTGVEAARLRSEHLQATNVALVKTAALGRLEKNPNFDLAEFEKKYADYIKPAEIQELQRAAKTYQRLAQGEVRQQRAEVRREAKDDFNGQVTKLLADMMPQKPGDPLRVPDDAYDRLRKLAVHPGATQEPGRLAAAIKSVEAVVDRLNKPEPLGPVSHKTTMDILGKIRSGAVADTGAIYDAYGKGDLNREDFNFLTKEFTNLKTPQGEALGRDRDQFFKRFGPSIDPSVVGNQGGSDKLYVAEMDARRQEGILRAKNLDPHLVYDPRSEYFFGKPDNISKYKQPLQQMLQDRTAKPAEKPITLPTVTERKAGQIYPTARGDMKWTGTGWVAP